MIEWIYKAFDSLTPGELYKILRLRSEVFVVEQNCVFLDADNKDQQCYHLMGWQNDDLVAYVRLVPAGLSYKEAAIGRVVSSPAYRSKGIGKDLMQKAIETLYDIWGRQTIRIGAQLYLTSFYEKQGFIADGDIYMEDGIEHIEMLLPY
jgi:ElaA protein